jgi:hypothetical protein
MEDDDLCARAIAAYDDGEVSCDGGGLVGHLEGSFMKPSHWSLARYMMCPPAYTWALQRVMERHEARLRRKKSGTGGPQAGTDQPLSEMFVEVLRAYRGDLTCLRL